MAVPGRPAGRVANFADWRSGSLSLSKRAALNPNSGFILGGQDEAARPGDGVSSN